MTFGAGGNVQDQSKWHPELLGLSRAVWHLYIQTFGAIATCISPSLADMRVTANLLTCLPML